MLMFKNSRCENASCCTRRSLQHIEMW